MLKMKIHNSEFTGETYAELLQNIWNANNLSAPLEVLEVCQIIQIYIWEEFAETPEEFDHAFKVESWCKETIEWVKAVTKNE